MTNRRRFMSGLVTTGTVVIAGCLGDGEDDTSDSDADSDVPTNSDGNDGQEDDNTDNADGTDQSPERENELNILQRDTLPGSGWEEWPGEEIEGGDYVRAESVGFRWEDDGVFIDIISSVFVHETQKIEDIETFFESEASTVSESFDEFREIDIADESFVAYAEQDRPADPVLYGLIRDGPAIGELRIARSPEASPDAFPLEVSLEQSEELLIEMY